MNCCNCKQNLSEELFSWKSKAKGIRHTRCKSCMSLYNKKHYSVNRTAYIDRSRITKLRVIPENNKYILEYLSTHPCADCGISDIRVLQFDHIVPLKRKRGDLRCVAYYNYSLSRMKEEIEKCEIRCANCHMIKMAIECGRERVML